MIVADPDLDLLCGPGADPAFDQTISAMARVACAKPEPLINMVVEWSSEVGWPSRTPALQSDTSHLASQISPVASERPSHLSQSSTAQGSLSSSSSQGLGAPLTMATPQQVFKERRRFVVSYITSRVLIEIFAQSNLQAVELKRVISLVDVIYNDQLKRTTLELLDSSAVRLQLFNITSKLLGVISVLDFGTVANQFLAELTSTQAFAYTPKEHMDKNKELHVVLLLMGMRNLRLQCDSESTWNKTTDCMTKLADLFAAVHGQQCKQAYCQLFEQLLLPLAAKNEANVADKPWRKFVATLHERLAKLATKPKYWHDAYPTIAILASVSPYDIFSAKWTAMVQTLSNKMRERNNRSTILKALCRYVWSLLRRIQYPVQALLKTIDEVLKVVFPIKRYPLSTDPAVAEPLIYLIRMIGFHHLTFCVNKIIFPLLNYEIFTASADVKVGDLEPDRMIIAIRGFLAMISDVESNEAPEFPVTFDDEKIDGPQGWSGPSHVSRLRSRSKVSASPRKIRSSRLVSVNDLSSEMNEYYKRFCEILGRLTAICDNTFGGQALLDERFSSGIPKTPIADTWSSFARREDSVNEGDSRRSYHALLDITVQALPRCLPSQSSIATLVRLLCTCTAHVKGNIASSSARSLKSIARQGHAQFVVTKFSEFILVNDKTYGMMTESDVLSSSHIENTLGLYVELLQVWIEEIRTSSGEVEAKGKIPVDATEGDNASEDKHVRLKGPDLELHIDRVESHGLLFLCSPSPQVRAFAVEVLHLVTELDSALNQTHTRIAFILAENSQTVMDTIDTNLSTKERVRLQKGMRTSGFRSMLIEICRSNEQDDLVLWYKMFPKLIKVIYDLCPMAVTQTWEDACTRLIQLQSAIEASLEERNHLLSPHLSSESNSSRTIDSLAIPDLWIDQWGLYLVFACVTLTKTTSLEPTTFNDASQIKHVSRPSQSSQDTFSTATGVFTRIIPLLDVDDNRIKDAVAEGLGSININLYRPLIECLESYQHQRQSEEHKRQVNSHHRGISSPRRQSPSAYPSTALARVYELTSPLISLAGSKNDEWILEHVATYLKNLALHLQVEENNTDGSSLQRHYCGLLENFFLGIQTTNNAEKWMSFQVRRASFVLLETWFTKSHAKDESQHKEEGENDRYSNRSRAAKPLTTASFREHRKLRDAASSAMAVLCGGPMAVTTTGGAQQLSTARILQWIDHMLRSDGDKDQDTGKRALQSLIVHNTQYPEILAWAIDKLYTRSKVKALDNYLEVLSTIFTDKSFTKENYAAFNYAKILSALLFTLGNTDSRARTTASHLLRHFEDRQGKSSNLQDLDVSVADKTRAVNKAAQFEISLRLSRSYSDDSFHIFSELCKHFTILESDLQRNIVQISLPWLSKMELQIDTNERPTPNSYMVLVNLLHITAQCSSTLENEVPALWQALAQDCQGNVKFILDFIIELSLDRKDINFMAIARQVVVALSTITGEGLIIQFLVKQIDPGAMIPDKSGEHPALIVVPPPTGKLAYVTELSSLFPDQPHAVSTSSRIKRSDLFKLNSFKLTSI